MNIAELGVTRIAETVTLDARFDSALGPDTQFLPNRGVTDAEALAEIAGRSCYESYGRPNAATAKTADYLTNIINQGHESVLEHGSVTYYITGVSRSLTHELVRHRHFSFSQLSQRFVDESDARMVLPPAVSPDSEMAKDLWNDFEIALMTYGRQTTALLAQGYPRKQAREAARSWLPNATETKIVLTGNHRAFREFLRKRLAPGADAEIQRLARVLLDDLSIIAPGIYEDIRNEYS